jgi:hypothetical protein
VAANKFTAYLAAKVTAPGRLRLIDGPPAAFLAPFPLHVLSLDTGLKQRLHLFGIRTLGQLAALPQAEIQTQFGTHGATLHRLARGEDRRPIVSPPRELSCSRQVALDDAVVNKLQLEQIVDTLSAELTTRLSESHHLAAGRIALHLELSDGSLLTPQRFLRQPSRTPSRLQRQARQLLQRCEFTAGVVSVALHFHDLVPVEVQQLSLFDPPAGGRAETLQEVIDELTERYESKVFVVGAEAQPDAQLPERRYKWHKVAGSQNTAIFRSAHQPITPLLDQDGVFSGFHWQGRRHTIAHVTAWREDTAWWEAQAQRDRYKVLTESGLLLLITHDALRDRWVVNHVFD